MLRGAASRVGPLALKLTEGSPLFSGGGRLITGGLVNDSTPERHCIPLTFKASGC